MRQEVNASFLFLKAVIMYEYFIGIFQYHTILLSYGINDAYKTLIWWEKMSSGWNFGLFWGGGWSGLCNCLKKLRIFHWILEFWPAKCHWQDVHQLYNLKLLLAIFSELVQYSRYLIVKTGKFDQFLLSLELH